MSDDIEKQADDFFDKIPVKTAKVSKSAQATCSLCDCPSWIDVKRHTPIIPVGKKAVSVFITVFDPIYEQISPGNACSTVEALFCEGGFKTLGVGGDGKWDFYPVFDIVLAWMYMPKPAPYTESK